MTGWIKDKVWSDVFMPEIKSIIGMNLIIQSSIEDDQEKNTDLVVLKFDSIRIAVRIRRSIYKGKYGDQFTIRSDRPTGQRTELSKIIEGWGNYFFYGFGSDNGHLDQWYLCDLNVFRLWYNQELYKGNHPGESKNNFDSSSSFMAFNFSDLPSNFVVAQKIKE